MSNKNIYFEDNLKIDSLDKNGKVFDRITRIEGTALDSKCKIILDVNSEIYKVSKDKMYSILITKSLYPDGNLSNTFNYEMYLKKNSLMENYDYVMNGKVFKLTEEADQQIGVHISFGGLIMGIIGDKMQLTSLNVDERVYFLMKKLD